MKKLMLTLGAFSFAFAAPVAVPTAASAAPATDIVEYCKSIIEFFPGHSLGECISSFRSNPNAFAAHWCLFYKNEGLLDDFGYKNMGDCVNDIKSLT